MIFTTVNNMNSSKAPSKRINSNPNTIQLSDKACTPIHKFEATIPMAAKLPDFLIIANPCNSNVATNSNNANNNPESIPISLEAVLAPEATTIKIKVA